MIGLLEDMSDNYRESEIETLSELASTIRTQRRLSDEAKLIWLSGCWLSSMSPLPPSPFAMGPADLVKDHFFEPALAVSEQDNIYMGLGNTHLQRIPGPLQMVLQHYEDAESAWWFLASNCNQAGFSSDFEGIESALSHCVQPCLATEPVLAVSLSICHEVLPEKFHEEFSKLWNSSLQQRTIGSLGGSLNDYFFFAALQMACHGINRNERLFPNTLSAASMVKRLWEYLSPGQQGPPSGYILRTATYNNIKWGYDFRNYSESRPKRTLEYSYGKEGNDDETSINNVHETTMMPWLVPACSHERLMKTIQETQRGKQSLFSEMHIAGLVPEFNESTSGLDASAYLWEGENLKCPAPLEWIFEFQRQPAEPYSMTQLCDHLEDKCASLSKKNNYDKALPNDTTKFHSMLVALTGSVQSECRIWLDDEQLRIVLLVGSQPFRLTWP